MTRLAPQPRLRVNWPAVLVLGTAVLIGLGALVVILSTPTIAGVG